MEPTNFDDYIKSNSKQDLPVPTELNWDNMNFTLPPAKRKSRILPWMLCLLIGALGIGSGLWYVYQRDIAQSRSLSKNDPIGTQNQNSKIVLKKKDATVDMAQPQDTSENTIASNNAINQEILKTKRPSRLDMAQPQDTSENTITSNNAINQQILQTKRPSRLDMAQPQDTSENTITSNNATNQQILQTKRPARLDMAQPQDTRGNMVTSNNVTDQKPIKTKRLAKADMANIQDAGGNTIVGNNVVDQKPFKTQRLAKADMANTQDAGGNTIVGNNVVDQKPFKTQRLAKIEMEAAKPLSLSEAAKSNDMEYEKAARLHEMEPLQLAGTEKTSQARLKLLKPNALLKILPAAVATSSENQLTVSLHARTDSSTKHITKPISLFVSIGMNKAQMNHNSASQDDAVTPAWGNSFQILLERELKNNWLLSIGLGYQGLHSTFYIEKDLGRSVNASQLEVIKRTRLVFHNNYFNFFSLNLGGGKQFKLSPRWHGQLLMYLSPSYRLSYTGRSLDDSGSIVAFDPNAALQKKWFFNADAALRFSYRLKKTDFIVGINLSQSLTKSDLRLVGSGTTTVQPRVLSFNLGIKRGLRIRKK
jgi:hypothetical protein